MAIVILPIAAWAYVELTWVSTADASTTQESAVVVQRPLTINLGLSGTIVPEDGVDVTAPFDGPVKMLGFAYGDRVEAGQVLAIIDPSDLWQKREDARMALLKAEQSYSDMARWDSGPEMARSHRSIEMARADLEDASRKADETKRLLDKGLVPRNEHESALQLKQSRRMNLAAAQTDFSETSRRGHGANLVVSQIERDLARKRFSLLSGQFGSATVRAPVSGIVVRPKHDPGDMGKDLRVGVAVTKGALIATIARQDSLAVRFEVDESDINQVKLGQPVTVTGSGFGDIVLTGRIIRLAGEGVAVGVGTSEKARFQGVARLDGITARQSARIRIGMSATISVEVYRKGSAIVVPPPSVMGASPSATLRIRDMRTGKVQLRAVQIGKVAPDGVEIVSGAKVGETVVWTALAPAPVTGL